MERFIFFLAVLIVTTVTAQDPTENEAKLAVDIFFEGFHKGDTTLMRSVMMDKVLMQTAYKNKEGKDVLVTEEFDKLLIAIANRTAKQNWDERLLDYSVQVDGNMANVWTNYEFWYNGQFSHCGVNSFQLFNDNGKWKIIYLIDTRRKASCKKE